jgi:hypothetical protein
MFIPSSDQKRDSHGKSHADDNYHMQATRQSMSLLERLQGKRHCCSRQFATEETPTARAKYIMLLPQKHV